MKATWWQNSELAAFIIDVDIRNDLIQKGGVAMATHYGNITFVNPFTQSATWFYKVVNSFIVTLFFERHLTLKLLVANFAVTK